MAKFIPSPESRALGRQLRTFMRRASVQFGFLFPSSCPVGGSTVGRAVSVRARGAEGPVSLQTDRRTQAGSEGAEGGGQGADRSRSPLPGSHLGASEKSEPQHPDR